MNSFITDGRMYVMDEYESDESLLAALSSDDRTAMELSRVKIVAYGEGYRNIIRMESVGMEAPGGLGTMPDEDDSPWG